MPSSNEHSTNGVESKSHRDERTLADWIQDQPVTCLAVAAAAGFVLGGGMRRTNGLALLALIGQMAARDVLTGFLTGALNSHAG